MAVNYFTNGEIERGVSYIRGPDVPTPSNPAGSGFSIIDQGSFWLLPRLGVFRGAFAMPPQD